MTFRAMISGAIQRPRTEWSGAAIITVMMLLLVSAIYPQSQASAIPRFEVASVKPCVPDTTFRTSRGGGGSPGLLRTQCQTVRDLVLTAYGAYANGHVNPPPLPPVEGGPKWIDS